MGNHHSHGSKQKGEASTPSSSGSSTNGSRKDISRSPSGSDIQDKPSNLMPVEKLAKILAAKSHEQDGVHHGITEQVFTKYLFPRYPLYAERLYNYLLTLSQSKNNYLSTAHFKQQCEKFMALLDDATVRNIHVRMFCDDGENLTRENMRSLLMCAYHVAMDHYSEGPQMCLGINKTLTAVVDSCYHTKKSLSCQFVAHWIETNCPRLLLTLHRYAMHALATSYRTLESDDPHLAAGLEKMETEGLELATPVLEQANPFSQMKHVHPYLLTMSMSWLLAGALPPTYSRPQRAHSPSNSGVGLSSQTFLMRLLCSVPSHWVNLYDSDEQGLGVNRFTHHVLAYKGATLCLLKVDNGQVFCIGCPNEWKESHLYWGGEDAVLFQLLPKFALLEKGSKILYLNTSIRGYPPGLRVGKDPRAPVIAVSAGFDKMEYRKIPYSLETIEVWGCGDQTMREAQLDVKKWEVKEAERQRCVKLSAADWLDHPDRYLLELAGRPQYSNQNPT